MEVREGDLKFLVNLTDYLDTGLYSDHRVTRGIIRKMAEGKDFLNLFAYTGAFTCAAALGGARSTVTVDRSKTYINWAMDNLKLNGLWNDKHRLIQSDALRYLDRAYRDGKSFDWYSSTPVVLYGVADGHGFDINRDHPQLIKMAWDNKTGRRPFFSTNHQGFVPRFDGLRKEIIPLPPERSPRRQEPKYTSRRR